MGLGVVHAGKNPLFAFEELQPHISRSDVARQTDKVVLLCTAAPDDAFLGCVAHGCDADDQPRHRSPRIAADHVDAQLLAGEPDALVEVVQRLDGQLGRNAERDEQLRRGGVHGENVAHGSRHDLVPQVLEREIGEVEVDPLEKRIGRKNRPLAGGRSEHRAVVARTAQGRSVGGCEAGGEPVDQSEFAQFGDFGAFFLRCHSLKFLQN